MPQTNAFPICFSRFTFCLSIWLPPPGSQPSSLSFQSIEELTPGYFRLAVRIRAKDAVHAVNMSSVIPAAVKGGIIARDIKMAAEADYKEKRKVLEGQSLFDDT